MKNPKDRPPQIVSSLFKERLAREKQRMRWREKVLESKRDRKSLRVKERERKSKRERREKEDKIFWKCFQRMVNF